MDEGDIREEAPAGGTPPPPHVVATLVEQHRRFLAFLERRVGSRADAEDILQEAFVRGLTRAGQLRDDESAVAWFYRTLRNAVVDHWRRRGSRERMLERAAAFEPDPVAGVDEELMAAACACVTDLLDTLRPAYAEALRRVDVEGVPVGEYARQAGITANNASVRLFRARQELRERVTSACGTCAEHGCLDCQCGGPAGC